MLISTFVHTRYIKRSQGGSACRTAAYNARACIFSNKLQTLFDFRKKEGLSHHTILLPTHASPSFFCPTTLWNTVESAEKRKDSQLAKEVLIRLPNTLTHPQTLHKLAHTFVQKTFCSEGLAAQVDVHTPPYNENLNWHTHILLPLRRLTTDGKSFEQYKASDLEPTIRGKSHHVIARIPLETIWLQFMEEFCAQHNTPVQIPFSHGGSLKSEGPRYTNTPHSVLKHNRNINTTRAREYANPQTALSILTKNNDVFSLRDISRYMASYIPEESLQKPFLEEIIHHKNTVCLGNIKSKQHYGIFTHKRTYQSLHSLDLSHIPLINNIDSHITQKRSWLLAQSAFNAHRTITNAQLLPATFLNNLSQNSQGSWTFEHGSITGPSSFLWKQTPHTKIHFLPKEDDPLEAFLNIWKSQSDPIVAAPELLPVFNQSARVYLQRKGNIDTRALYIGTPFGPLSVSEGERIIWHTENHLTPGMITALDNTSVTVKLPSETIKRPTHTILPITYAYALSPTHQNGISLCTPPLSTYPAHRCLVMSQRHVQNPSSAFHAISTPSWHPHLSILNPSTLLHQHELAIAALSLHPQSFEEKLHHIIQEVKTYNVPECIAHTMASSILFHRTFDPQTPYTLSHHVKELPMVIARFKSAPQPLSPLHTLAIETSFTQPQVLMRNNHSPLGFQDMLEHRHHTTLNSKMVHYAQQAHAWSFGDCNPQKNSWLFYDLYKKQEWAFYHLVWNNTLPKNIPSVSSLYHHQTRNASHELFNTPSAQEKIFQHTLIY
ncbi:MAG: MobA/MobL family protein [Alphaproteobacteria bacterium]|nr:MobA/MobL family protein [Alphaproteobacteria bacterium]